MKQRRRIFCAGIGAALIAGSMLGFPGTAHAAPGDFTINGVITLDFILSTSGVGAGTITPGAQTATSAGSWNGTWTATGTALSCFVIGITANDTIAWTAGIPATATEDLSNTVITIDSTNCPNPPQGICILTLNSTKRLTSSSFPIDNTIPPTGKVRKGTFTTPAGTQIGNYTISEGTGCFSSGLAQQIAINYGFGGSVGAGPTFSSTSTMPFSATLVKTLQTRV